MSSRPANEEILRRPQGGLQAAAPAPRLRAIPRAERPSPPVRAVPPHTAPRVGPRLAPPPRLADAAGAALVLAAPFLLWAYFLAATAQGVVR